MMKMKKLMTAALAALVALAMLAGCTGQGQNNAASSTTAAAESTQAADGGDQDGATALAEGGEDAGAQASGEAGAGASDTELGFDMRMCIASEPQTIDPQLNTSVDGAIMIHHMFEGLMKWVDDGAGNAVLAEGQAESYDKAANADGTITYTFHLRDGIKWSDGQPVTAQDFVNGLQRLVNPATAADYNYIVGGIILNAQEIMDSADGKQPEDLGVAAIDEKTLTITLVNECPYFIELLAFPPLFPTRKDLIDANGDQWTFDPATYIGNGPYKLTDWEHNSYIYTAKNENYYDYGKLGPDTIRYVLMDDHNAILSAYRSGELDFIENMPVDEIPNLKESGELVIADYIGTYYASFQVQKAPFDDPRVREAFTLTIDRQNITDNITRTGEVPADGFVPSGINDANPSGDDFRTVGGGWYSINPEDYAANAERARELLADAGYPGGEGFPVVEYLYNTDSRHQAIGEALQADWQRELGVTVTLANQEWGVFLETRKEGNFQIARNGWIADYNDPISFLEMWVTGSGNNDAQYSNPAFDALIANTRSIADPAERMKALHDAEKLMQDDFMLGPIYFYTQKYMLNPEIKGMYYTPLGYFLFDTATKS
ncbi:MAG: peptide ABC transporter substrate-binding protein [Clostridiales bacterium]|jgi:oligopeptide transport system substrate-binding protein|nr:peptide ABC transporter substrate-binding protein [Clostridiales bacterium]